MGSLCHGSGELEASCRAGLRYRISGQGWGLEVVGLKDRKKVPYMLLPPLILYLWPSSQWN